MSSKLHYETEQNLPNIKKVKTEWNLKKHYYKNENDPQIELDIKKTESAYTAFNKKYASGAWTKQTESIIKAVRDYLALTELPGYKPLYYLFYRRELDANDVKAEKLANKLEIRLTEASNQVIFFELQLAKISKTQQKTLLKDPKADSMRYYLQSVFDNAKYQLSEPEERILSLRSMTSRGLWISSTEKILNKQSITWKGKNLPINAALMQVMTLPSKERLGMWKKIIPVLQEVGVVAENELTALAHDKKVSDDLRGYKKPYSATTKAYDSSDQTLEKLVSVMETRGYALSRKYYQLKSKHFGKKLEYINRDQDLSTLPTVPYETAVTIVRDVFYALDSKYGQIFDTMLTESQIDVWPKPGRGGGAFCSSGINQPTFVFLNQNDSVDSLRTLAHEMGHAIHAYRSKEQPAHYEGHSILTAETASTFFESLVAEAVIDAATGKQKAALLDSFISQKIGTMIMCIARYKAELAMHHTIREEGAMDAKALSTTLANEFKKYCGPAVTVEWTDGLSILAKTHYRRNFYQYSYSFGEVGSSIMRNRLKADAGYLSEVDKFLTLGESQSVEDIFRSVGIDMTKESTYHEALDLLEEDIKTLQKLIK